MDALGHILAGIFGTMVNKPAGGTFRSISGIMEAVISLTTPFAINAHLYLFAANRLALGFFAVNNQTRRFKSSIPGLEKYPSLINGFFFQGLSFVSLADIFVHWTPSGERARSVTTTMLGYGLGLASTYPLSGLIIQNFGWQFLFYILGKYPPHIHIQNRDDALKREQKTSPPSHKGEGRMEGETFHFTYVISTEQGDHQR